MNFNLGHISAAVLSAFALASCGGGGSGDVVSNDSTNNTATTQTENVQVAGLVQGIGSCVVNGKRLSTVGAEITDEDDRKYSTSDLALGQYAIVQASFDGNTETGSAAKIILRREFSGPLSAVNGSGFEILGQTFTTDATTVYRQEGNAKVLSLSDLSAGDYVEAYGLVQANGAYLATHVELQNSKAELDSGIEARGDITNLDSNAQSFQIGGLLVDYSSADVKGTLADGVEVRVKATQDPTLVSGSSSGATLSLVVTSVATQAGLQNSFTSARVEIKGVVTSDAGDSDVNTFDVGGVIVDISNLSSAEKALFVNDALLEVEGTLQNNLLLATEAEDEDDRASSRGGRYEFYGVATDGQFSNNQLTFNVQSQPVVFGQDVCGITSGTPYVEVKGELINGVIQANKVECEGTNDFDDDDERDEFRGSRFELEGVVSNFDRATTQFELRGVKVKAANARFEDGTANDLAEGVRLEVKGAMDANNEFLIADEVEFEDRDDD